MKGGPSRAGTVAGFGPSGSKARRRAEALRRECPKCGAAPRAGCHDPRTKRYQVPIAGIHPARMAPVS